MSTDQTEYSYYPFLINAQRPILQLDEQTILYAKDHIDKYTPTKLEDIDISVWLVSTIILHNLKNNFLIKKFVTNYSKLFESHLSTDFKDKEVRKAILYHLNILNKDVIVSDKNRIKLHMKDYLEIALEVSDRYPQFLLTNCDLEKGFVHLDIPKFVYLIRLVIEQQLYDKIKNGMKDYFDNEMINKVVLELGGRYPETIKRVSNPAGSSTVPQNIQDLINKAYNEHNLSHSERRKLGIYLQGQNFDWEYIIDIFKSLSDYDPKITEYQLKSLRKYIKP